MKQYLKRLFGVKQTRVIDFNGSRFVEIAHARPTPLFLSETLWLRFIEPLKRDKGMQEVQVSSMLNEFDFAAFSWSRNLFDGPLLFKAHLLCPDCSEMSFVSMSAAVYVYKPNQAATFLDSMPQGMAQSTTALKVVVE